ncbi:MAG: helix-turn-helix transcriptional regulator [Curtobacterium sp.]
MSDTDATEPLWRHLVGARLRDLRRDRAATINDVARRAGVSPQYLSEMERGRKEPSSEMIAAVAGALDTSLLDLTSAVAEGLRERAHNDTSAGSQVRTEFALAA